jgi:DNA-binding NarL/FixJ family response regulator
LDFPVHECQLIDPRRHDEVSAGDAPERLRLLVADDRPTRLGVRMALSGHDFDICAEAADAPSAVAAAFRERPDIAMLAVDLPGGGIRAAERVASALAGASVVMLAATFREEDLFAALRAGAVGYLVKGASSDRLAHTLRSVAAGEPAIPRHATVSLIEAFRRPKPGGQVRRPAAPADRAPALTRREWEVLELLGRRAPTREMAELLAVSPITVRRHVSQIARKLGVPDRASLHQLIQARSAR